MRAPSRVGAAILFLSSSLVVPAVRAASYLSDFSGSVQVLPSGSSQQQTVKVVPWTLHDGDSVQTGSRSSAVITLPDNSHVTLSEKSAFTLERTETSLFSMYLSLGRLRASVEKMVQRQFQVRTANAVCSVRGTEFQVQIDGGKTLVELYRGLLAINDNRGHEMLLHPNERIEVGLEGIKSAMRATNMNVVAQHFHEQMRRELALDMTKEQVQSSAAREIKLAEYQQGKSLINVSGDRVRLEEYIMRPAPNQFKFVVLNETSKQLNYFYYLGTFNTTLPANLSLALQQLSGTVGVAPTYYLTSYQTGRSNLQDSIVENAQGGHPVDVNFNGVAADAVSYHYNSTTNLFDYVGGQHVYQTLFDKYGFYVNGNLKYGWTGSNIQSYSQTTAASTNDPISGALLANPLPVRTVSSTFPDANSLHQQIFESYSDGTSIQWDNYIINDQGQVASPGSFAAALNGASYQQALLNFNYEQTVTASEFQGRKIDLVVEPKIFIQSGLIQ